MRFVLVAILGCLPAAMPAQHLDPDWCWTCVDSRQHFAAGVGIDVAAHILLPQTHVWQRMLVTCAIGAAYEAGQAESGRNASGPGYGFGPKDLVLDCAGAATAELAWGLFHHRHRHG